jgi:hypothetical protein
LSLADNDNHVPDAHPLWQESSLVCFCDPDAGLAGFHRIGIHPNNNQASIYSWTQIGGKLISVAKRTGLPIPPGPTTNTQLDGVRLTTLEPLLRYRYQVDRDAVTTDVEFTSYTGPVQLTLDIGGAVVAPGHYNMLGAVRGEIVSEGRRHAFDGVGFQDHSWGPRDGRKILGHRWIMAVFDARNMVCVIPTFGPNGHGVVGYVMLDGELAPLRAARTSFTIASDNLRIEGCRAHIEDGRGRTLTLTGEAQGADCLQPYGQGYFAVHSPAVFDWDGRRGIGYLEWSPMRGIPAVRREALGLAADDEWLNDAAALR